MFNTPQKQFETGSEYKLFNVYTRIQNIIVIFIRLFVKLLISITCH